MRKIDSTFPQKGVGGQVAVRDGRSFWNTPFLAVGLAFRTEKFAILEIETLFSRHQRRTALPGTACRCGGRPRILHGLSYFLGLFVSPLRKLLHDSRNAGSGARLPRVLGHSSEVAH